MTDEEICKENKKLKKHLKELTVIVKQSINSLDVVMKDCQEEPLGKYVAQIANHIELANDRARYFGLGIDYRKDKKTTSTIEQETLRRVAKVLKSELSEYCHLDIWEDWEQGQWPEGWEE